MTKMMMMMILSSSSSLSNKDEDDTLDRVVQSPTELIRCPKLSSYYLYNSVGAEVFPGFRCQRMAWFECLKPPQQLSFCARHLIGVGELHPVVELLPQQQAYSSVHHRQPAPLHLVGNSTSLSGGSHLSPIDCTYEISLFDMAPKRKTP